MSSTARTRGTGFVAFEAMGSPARRRPVGQPLSRLVSVLKARVELGEDAEAVLDSIAIHRPRLRKAYLAAAGLDTDGLDTETTPDQP